ncbi:hypothetical protein E4U17_006222 [Claviceps sp. LM77 group G4]|nr:hypothetical protein E4U17_006222 [Claviceps sp. LM77 group G4]KAG6056230.1 hypothetical protein E4U33_007735 [Claviceps sp. LM78 group G4]
MADNFSLSELCFMAALAVAGAVVVGEALSRSANPHKKEFQFDFLLPGNSVRSDMIPNSVIAKALSWQRTRAAKLDDSFFKNFSAELFYGFRAEVQVLAKNQHRPSIESSNAADPVSDTSAHSKWLAAPCFPFCLKIVARLTIFSLFGESLCRDVAFLDLCCEFGNALPMDALLLRSLPSWAKP